MGTRFLWRLKIAVAAAMLFPIFGAAANVADEPYTVVIDRGIAVKMRDGVTLRADVYRPKADGKFPVLLTRTPYDKTGSLDTCMQVAAAGYVCIAQDCRGRYTSEGEWYPFKHESEDGYDTIEWVAHQPYSTGVVGMWGASYVGATQLLAAIARPPHLAGIFVMVTASDYHENWTYQGGAFQQWFDESWTSGLAEDTMRRKTIGSAGALQWSKTMPLANYPVILPGDPKSVAPYFEDWLAHPNYDDYWKQWSIEADYSRINIPVFHIGAWYDIFLGGTLRNYAGLKSGAGNDFSRENQRLLIEIGGHSGNGRKVGEVDFGPHAEYDESAVMLRWYDFLFKNVANGMDKEKPVRVFTMGVNEWRDFDAWPPPGAKTTRMFLHSAGKANMSSGDGTLSSAQPAKEPTDHYLYNPNDPVPTHGGPLCCYQALPGGPRNQAEVEKRPDVLVYTTAPLKQDLDVTGPVTLDLFVQSSGPRHRLHRQIGGCVAQRLRAKHHRRNPADALSRFALAARPHDGGPGLQDYCGSLGNEQRLPRRTQIAPRGVEQQLPALRPQPQHRRDRHRACHTRSRGHEHDPSRSRASLRADPERAAGKLPLT